MTSSGQTEELQLALFCVYRVVNVLSLMIRSLGRLVIVFIWFYFLVLEAIHVPVYNLYCKAKVSTPSCGQFEELHVCHGF